MLLKGKVKSMLIFIIVIRMKEKVKQQEMELNASNPRVFMEAQSATKQEVIRALPLWIYFLNCLFSLEEMFFF